MTVVVCKVCGRPLVCAACSGRQGGEVKGRKKGFADPRVLAKALETRKKNRSG